MHRAAKLQQAARFSELGSTSRHVAGKEPAPPVNHMTARGIGLVALLTMSVSSMAIVQGDPYPDAVTYAAKREEFAQRLAAQLTAAERAVRFDKCLASRGGIDRDDTCKNALASGGYYELGWTACKGLRIGHSRELILEEALTPDDQRLNEVIFDAAVQVLCPEFADKGDGSRIPEPPAPGVAADSVEFKPDPAKDRKFIDRMIEHLPADTRDDYRRVCKNYDRNCPLWGFSAYGDAACEALRQGQTREQILEGMAGFFSPSEDQAIVDTAIEVICPQYGRRK